MLKQTQNLKQSQKLIPALMMNQKLLSAPIIVLEDIVRNELELNPMLEEDSDASAETDLNPEITLKDELTGKENDTESKSTDEDSDSDVMSSENSIESKIENEYDWDEYFENEADEYKNYENNHNVIYDYGNLKEKTNSFDNNLMLQLHLSELTDKEIFIGDEIIWSLNEDGYFTESADNIKKDLEFKKIGTEFEKENFSDEEIEKVLNYIQMNLDPKGVAARNLKECMLIQIKRSAKSEQLKNYACEIVNNHLDDLMFRKYEKVSSDMNIPADKVGEIFDFIHKLNPKPGFDETETDDNYIIPDLIVKKINGNYEVSLNESNIPSLRINKTYRDMYKNRKRKIDKETKNYLVNNFNKAKWFIEAVNSRRETLLKVMNAIILRQREFFDRNGEGIKSMYEKEIAEDIQMDSSTVSRCVRGKYVQTDFGIYELRSFFNTPFHRTENKELSGSEIKNMVKNIIAEENKKKPMTDDEIAAKLGERGFKISRRTVSKYRESLNIPIAKLRREILI